MVTNDELKAANAVSGDLGLKKTWSANEGSANVTYQNTVPGPYYNLSDYWSALGRMIPAQQLTPERMQAERQAKRREAISSVLYSVGGRN